MAQLQSTGITGSLTVTGNSYITSTFPTLYFTDTNGDPDYYISAGNGYFRVHDNTNDATRLYISSTGNVGIGTTSPSTVGGTAKMTINVGSGISSPISIVNSTTDGMYIRRYGASGQYQLQTTVGAANSGNLSLQSYGGNVGIGTTSPSEKLHVVGNISASGQFIGANFGLDSTDKLQFSTETLQIRLGDASRYTIGPTIFRPTDDEGASLGRSTDKWKELVVNHITASGNISASGDITVDNLEVTGYLTASGDLYLTTANIYTPASTVDFFNPGSAAKHIRAAGAQFSTSYSGGVPSNGILFYNDTTLYRSDTTTLTTNGNFIVEGTLTAREFHTEFVSSSIIYQSGSTKFGDTSDDTHEFTGSINLEVSESNKGFRIYSAEGIQVFSVINGNSNTFPVGAMTIGYGSTNAGQIIGQSNTLKIRGGSDASGKIIFTNGLGGADEIARFDSTGLGIGTTTPDTELHVESLDAMLTLEGSNSSYINAATQLISNHASNARGMGTFAYDSSSQVEWFWGNPYSYNDAFVINRNTGYTTPSSKNSPPGIGASAGTLFKIGNDGRVGIGTTAPAKELEVDGGIRIGANETIESNGSITVAIDVNNNETNRAFTIAEGSALNALLTVKESGNVGIGTISPSEKLTVAGNISASGDLQLDNTITFTGETSLINTSWSGGEGDIKINPEGQLYLGEQSTNNVLIGRTNNSLYTTILYGGNTTENIKVSLNSVELKVPVTASSDISVSGQLITNHLTASNALISGSLTVEGSGSTIFEVNGSEGQLFSITDSLSGSLFAVSDVSGLPILEVFSDDRVVAGAFNQNDFVISGSKVGIGTGNPESSLQITGTTGITLGENSPENQKVRLYADSSDSGYLTAGLGSGKNLTIGGSYWTIQMNASATTHDASNHIFRTHENQEFVRFESANKRVGIRTTTPSASLHIKGANNLTSDYALKIDNSSNQNILVVQNDGKVGIGTTNPAYQFTVQGTSYIKQSLLHTSAGYGIVLDANVSQKIGFPSLGNFAFENVNVGIGTTNPATKLEVAGVTTVRKSGTATPHADTDLLVTDATAVLSTAQIQILGGNAGSSNLKFSDTDDYSVGSIDYSHSADSMSFRTNNTTQATITSTGNIGIGTTTPSASLHVKGANAIADSYALKVGNSTTDNILVVENDGKVGIGTDNPSAQLHLQEGNSKFVFDTANNSIEMGNAGGFFNTLTFSLGSMTLNASGNGGDDTFKAGPGYVYTNLIRSGINGDQYSKLTLQSRYYGISTTTSAMDFMVFGSGGSLNTTRIALYNGDNGAAVLQPTGGNVGISTSSPRGKLDVSGSFLGSVTDITPTNQTASLDCSLGNFFTLTLSSNADTFLTASNIQPGQSINLRITQPATSGSLSYGSEFKFPNGAPYTVSATGSVEDILSFIAFDSNTLYGSSLKNFQ